MGQQSATGSGPNKKLAKRAAAEVERMRMLNVVERFHSIAEKLKCSMCIFSGSAPAARIQPTRTAATQACIA